MATRHARAWPAARGSVASNQRPAARPATSGGRSREDGAQGRCRGAAGERSAALPGLRAQPPPYPRLRRRAATLGHRSSRTDAPGRRSISAMRETRERGVERRARDRNERGRETRERERGRQHLEISDAREPLVPGHFFNRCSISTFSTGLFYHPELKEVFFISFGLWHEPVPLAPGCAITRCQRLP